MTERDVPLVLVTDPDYAERAKQALADEGVVVIRGLVTQDRLAKIGSRWDVYFDRPSVSGTPGYARTSAAKSTVSAFALGREAVQAMLDERIVDIVEAVMGSECTLAEANAKHDRGLGYTYFPLHSDFAIGWKKTASMEKALTAEDMHHPIGIGGMIYMHDTTEGAFTYCLGTQKLESPHGQRFNSYPAAMQAELLKTKVRCDGLAGDFVLFDDRGFHGPDQPSKSDRSVLLLDYYRIETFGRIVVSPHPVWSEDLAELSQRQLQVMGMGASSLLPPEKYDKSRFRRNRFFPMLAWMVDHAYGIEALKGRIRHLFRRRRQV